MENNTFPTLQAKKDKAIEVMKILDIYKPFIQSFKQSDKVCFFETFGGFWVYQEPEIEKKMKEIERKYNCKVFAITHEITNIGELWNFLVVSNYPEEWDDMVYSHGNKHTLLAYVWNKSDEDCSEFGDITVQSSAAVFGGLRNGKSIYRSVRLVYSRRRKR